MPFFSHMIIPFTTGFIRDNLYLYHDWIQPSMKKQEERQYLLSCLSRFSNKTYTFVVEKK